MATSSGTRPFRMVGAPSSARLPRRDRKMRAIEAFGFDTAEPVAFDDPRLPPALANALLSPEGTCRFLIRRVWPRSGQRVATLAADSGSDGVIILVSDLANGIFRNVAHLVSTLATTEGNTRHFDLAALFSMPLDFVCGMIGQAAKARSLAWSEHVTVGELHGRMTPKREQILELAAHRRHARPGPPPPVGVFPGPNRIAAMLKAPLSAPVVCTAKEGKRGQPDTWSVSFKRAGDFILVAGPPRSDWGCPLTDNTMSMDAFAAACDRSLAGFWARRQRSAREALVELLDSASEAGPRGDALDAFLLALERESTSRSPESYSVLPDNLPRCLGLESDYQAYYKYANRWRINRICSALRKMEQPQLADAILARVREKGLGYVAQSTGRRNSLALVQGRQKHMESGGGEVAPSCGGCTLACPLECGAGLDLDALDHVGPVEMIIERAKQAEAARKAAALLEEADDEMMATLFIPNEDDEL